MATEIVTIPTFRAGTPRPLGVPVPFTPAWPDQGALWDSAPDGRSFVVATPAFSKMERSAIMLNWQAGLKK